MLPNLFLIELKKRWVTLINYPLDELLATGIWIFIAVFTVMGFRYTVGAGTPADCGHRLEALILGWSMWLLTTNIVYGIHSEVADEAKTGTLQQLMMTPFSLQTVLIMRAISDLTVQLISASAVLCGIVFFTHTNLHFSAITLLPTLLLVTGALGLSLMLGALRIAFRRIGGLLNIASWVLFALVIAPIEEMAGKFAVLLNFVPLVPALSMMRAEMTRNAPLDWPSFGIATVNAAAYLALGMLAFRIAERRAKQRCTLDKY